MAAVSLMALFALTLGFSDGIPLQQFFEKPPVTNTKADVLISPERRNSHRGVAAWEPQRTPAVYTVPLSTRVTLSALGLNSLEQIYNVSAHNDAYARKAFRTQSVYNPLGYMTYLEDPAMLVKYFLTKTTWTNAQALCAADGAALYTFGHSVQLDTTMANFYPLLYPWLDVRKEAVDGGALECGYLNGHTPGGSSLQWDDCLALHEFICEKTATATAPAILRASSRKPVALIRQATTISPATLTPQLQALKAILAQSQLFQTALSAIVTPILAQSSVSPAQVLQVQTALTQQQTQLTATQPAVSAAVAVQLLTAAQGQQFLGDVTQALANVNAMRVIFPSVLLPLVLTAAQKQQARDLLAQGQSMLDTQAGILNAVTPPTTVTVPTVSLTPGTLPTVSLTTGTLPTVTVPTVSLTSGTLPTVNVPTVSLTTGTLPTVSLTTGTLPTVSLTTGTLPTVTVPTVSSTTGTLPTVNVPTVTIPTVSLTTGTLPTVNVPTVTIPTVSLTTGTLPTVTTPTVSTTTPMTLLQLVQIINTQAQTFADAVTSIVLAAVAQSSLLPEQIQLIQNYSAQTQGLLAVVPSISSALLTPLQILKVQETLTQGVDLLRLSQLVFRTLGPVLNFSPTQVQQVVEILVKGDALFTVTQGIVGSVDASTQLVSPTQVLQVEALLVEAPSLLAGLASSFPAPPPTTTTTQTTTTLTTTTTATPVQLTSLLQVMQVVNAQAQQLFNALQLIIDPIIEQSSMSAAQRLQVRDILTRAEALLAVIPNTLAVISRSTTQTLTFAQLKLMQDAVTQAASLIDQSQTTLTSLAPLTNLSTVQIQFIISLLTQTQTVLSFLQSCVNSVVITLSPLPVAQQQQAQAILTQGEAVHGFISSYVPSTTPTPTTPVLQPLALVLQGITAQGQMYFSFIQPYITGLLTQARASTLTPADVLLIKNYISEVQNLLYVALPNAILASGSTLTLTALQIQQVQNAVAHGMNLMERALLRIGAFGPQLNLQIAQQQALLGVFTQGRSVFSLVQSIVYGPTGQPTLPPGLVLQIQDILAQGVSVVDAVASAFGGATTASATTSSTSSVPSTTAVTPTTSALQPLALVLQSIATQGQVYFSLIQPFIVALLTQARTSTLTLAQAIQIQNAIAQTQNLVLVAMPNAITVLGSTTTLMPLQVQQVRNTIVQGVTILDEAENLLNTLATQLNLSAAQQQAAMNVIAQGQSLFGVLQTIVISSSSQPSVTQAQMAMIQGIQAQSQSLVNAVISSLSSPMTPITTTPSTTTVATTVVSSPITSLLHWQTFISQGHRFFNVIAALLRAFTKPTVDAIQVIRHLLAEAQSRLNELQASLHIVTSPLTLAVGHAEQLQATINQTRVFLGAVQAIFGFTDPSTGMTTAQQQLIQVISAQGYNIIEAVFAIFNTVANNSTTTKPPSTTTATTVATFKSLAQVQQMQALKGQGQQMQALKGQGQQMQALKGQGQLMQALKGQGQQIFTSIISLLGSLASPTATAAQVVQMQDLLQQAQSLMTAIESAIQAAATPLGLTPAQVQQVQTAIYEGRIFLYAAQSIFGSANAPLTLTGAQQQIIQRILAQGQSQIDALFGVINQVAAPVPTTPSPKSATASTMTPLAQVLRIVEINAQSVALFNTMQAIGHSCDAQPTLTAALAMQNKGNIAQGQTLFNAMLAAASVVTSPPALTSTQAQVLRDTSIQGVGLLESIRPLFAAGGGGSLLAFTPAQVLQVQTVVAQGLAVIGVQNGVVAAIASAAVLPTATTAPAAVSTTATALVATDAALVVTRINDVIAQLQTLFFSVSAPTAGVRVSTALRNRPAELAQRLFSLRTQQAQVETHVHAMAAPQQTALATKLARYQNELRRLLADRSLMADYFAQPPGKQQPITGLLNQLLTALRPLLDPIEETEFEKMWQIRPAV